MFLHLANYRRCGDDFSELYENGGASREDKRLYDLIRENAPILSRDLKYMSGYSFRRGKGFDPVIMRLQNETYILISDFVYQRNRFGEPYGWGIAEYSTPEQFFGEQFSAHLYDSTPEESFDILADHLCSLLDVRKSIIEQVLE